MPNTKRRAQNLDSYTVFVSDEAWNAIARPRLDVLRYWPLAPVPQFLTVQRRLRFLRLDAETAAKLEAIAVASNLRNPFKPYETSPTVGLIGLAIESIGQSLRGLI